jgi:hypothetical protein
MAYILRNYDVFHVNVQAIFTIKQILVGFPPNITSYTNRIQIVDQLHDWIDVLILPSGFYTLDNLNSYIARYLRDGFIRFEIVGDKIVQRSSPSYIIRWINQSPYQLLGFDLNSETKNDDTARHNYGELQTKPRFSLIIYPINKLDQCGIAISFDERDRHEIVFDEHGATPPEIDERGQHEITFDEHGQHDISIETHDIAPMIEQSHVSIEPDGTYSFDALCWPSQVVLDEGIYKIRVVSKSGQLFDLTKDFELSYDLTMKTSIT